VLDVLQWLILRLVYVQTHEGTRLLYDFLQNAFAMATQIGGIVIDKRSEAELIQAAAQDGANAHKTLIGVCNDEVSKLVVGQVLSSSAKNTGLGSGVANLHGEVRQDIRVFDMRKLSETLKQQLFRPYLRMNGYRGAPPDILWGGEKETDLLQLAQGISQLKAGGLEPTDAGIATVSQRIGIGLQRAPEPKPALAANPMN
jgi:phage gp29-like protein